MQRKRQGEDEPIHSGRQFDGFGSHRSMISSIFGGRDPFDDPFFNRPFEGMFGPSIFDTHGTSDHFPAANSSKGLIIEELDTDDEDDDKEEVKKGDSEIKEKKAWTGVRSSKDPLVEHPGDEEEGSKEVSYNSNHDRIEGNKPRTHSISFKKVTYGGINGAYYSATTTRKSGSDGVVLEESKQADKSTGQATHRISRGINDKGHSVTRKLGTDGKVDAMQTLHNLNEDELAGFEQAWKDNADRQLPGWNRESTNPLESAGSVGMQSFGLALPQAGSSVGARHGDEGRANPSGGRSKKVVTINIE